MHQTNSMFRTLHFSIFVALHAVTTVAVFLSGSITLQFYTYSLIVCQVWGYGYVLTLRSANRGKWSAQSRFPLVLLVTLVGVKILGVAIGWANLTDGLNRFELVMNYSIMVVLQVSALYMGFKCARDDLWYRVRHILLLNSIMEAVNGFARQIGDTSGARSSVGLLREGFWPLIYGRKNLFLLLSTVALYFVATSGMRIAILTALIYVSVLVYVFRPFRGSRRLSLLTSVLSLALFLGIAAGVLAYVDRSSLPPSMQVTLNRVERTVGLADGGPVSDGRDIEAEAAYSELLSKQSMIDIIFGRGVGFTYFNPRTQRYEVHVHLGHMRILTRYGILGILIYGLIIAFILVRFAYDLFRSRVDVVKVAFLHSLAFFLFFGEDVFISFWFLLGAALASCGAVKRGRSSTLLERPF